MRELKCGLLWGAIGFAATSDGRPLILVSLLTLLGYFVTLDIVRFFTKE